MNAPLSGAWFHRPKPLVTPRLRLFCFPYAGGAASVFHTWPAGLPPDVEVVAIALPGRAFRLREAPFTQMEPLLGALEGQLGAALNVPYAFFGHSMGAALAYELTQRFRAAARPLPQRLFVSARRAPHIRVNSPHVHTLPKQQFIQALTERYNTPTEVLLNPELQELVLPALRADLQILELWESSQLPPLSIPINAYAGQYDAGIPLPHLEAWKDCTTESFEMTVMPGNHLFLHSEQARLLAHITGVLQNKP